MRSSTRYEIIRNQFEGRIWYTVQYKGWIFWHYLCEGPEGDIRTFSTMYDAENAIEKHKLGRSSEVVKIIGD